MSALNNPLLKASILFSCFGLLFLAALSLSLEPSQVAIASITPASIGTPVKIVGTVVRDSQYPTVRILEVRDGSEITVPLFFTPEDKIKKGDRISVCGKVELYKEKLEVVPSNPRDIKQLIN